MPNTTQGKRPRMPDPGQCQRCGEMIKPTWLAGVGCIAGRWLTGRYCQSCMDAIQAEQREAQARQAAHSLLEAANMPREARGWDFARAEAEASRIKQGPDLEAWRKAAYYCRTWPTGSRKGLYIMGPSGTGKTLLSWCIIHAAVKDGRSALFLPVTDLFDEMRRSWSRDSMARDMVDRAKQADVLVFDEIGVDDQLRSWMRVALFKVIDFRVVNRRPTVFTSNCQPGELIHKLSDEHGRIMNRIIGSTNGVSLDGQSFRELTNGQRWLLK